MFELHLLDVLSLVALAWFLTATGALIGANITMVRRTWPLLARAVAFVVALVVAAVAYWVFVGLDVPSAIRALQDAGHRPPTIGSILRTSLMALLLSAQVGVLGLVTNALVRTPPRRDGQA